MHRFGAAESVPACGSVLSIGKEKEPFANFIFRYRPLEILRANGIAPLPPVQCAQTSSARTDSDPRVGGQSSKRGRKRGREDPSPAGDSGTADIKGEPDEEDEEDLAELQQQLVTIQRRIEAKAANRAKRKFKREVSPIRVPSSSSREPEVIDLT
ncbi:hypothetical protein NUW54_g2424 [Trametes sanguinea]|uniref:Uncharacterized protein n=1 Tax=Trametes sanguinea TaxID=158606 RepID=A0ACC1Q6R2_9APHY|nr:hypothetical protein NUW54_g2424 [Trametes sanguinea]